MSGRHRANSSERHPRRGRSHSREQPVREERTRSRSGSPKRRQPTDRDGASPAAHLRSSRRSVSRSPDRRQRSGSRSSDRHSRSRRGHGDKTKSRRRSRSKGVDSDHGRSEKRKRRRSRSTSRSSDSSDDERRKKRKEKHRKRSRSRERKKDKKKDKKRKKSSAVTAQWGKYGIINESDMYNKEQEFRAWLVEERKINPETQSKENTRKEFARFAEDYNTATLPHEKYYNMDQYEHRMNALRHGEFVPAGEQIYDANADLKAHQSHHKRKTVEKESYLSREQLLELRKVQNERIEAGKMKLLGMDIKQNMGVRMDGTAFDE